MAKPSDPGYWRKWRAAHPEYRARERARMAARDRTGRDRSGEYRPVPPTPPLPLLFPELQHGARVSFWEDELRMDLAQEAALALLEGDDPVERCRAYGAREWAWWRQRAPLIEDAV